MTVYFDKKGRLFGVVACVTVYVVPSILSESVFADLLVKSVNLIRVVRDHVKSNTRFFPRVRDSGFAEILSGIITHPPHKRGDRVRVRRR